MKIKPSGIVYWHEDSGCFVAEFSDGSMMPLEGSFAEEAYENGKEVINRYCSIMRAMSSQQEIASQLGC